MFNNPFRMEHHVFEELNDVLADPSNPLVADFLRVVAKYGTPEEINAKADEARKIPNILEKLRAAGSPYVQDLEWLVRERDRGPSSPSASSGAMCWAAPHPAPPLTRLER